jgi:hypothetical protein
MQLLEEYVNARVNAAEDARRQAERELLRQVRERGIVVRWREALQARRIVRTSRRAGRAEETRRPVGVSGVAGAQATTEAAERDLAGTPR